ncbi:beta-galactosidase [Pontiella agarivorans]|uniref:Beta-galactosidase n=1 Tax=Pontiella agarivorans TaxID=3038953 RepID=A0ABU5N2N2_9BACT|nr:beta-galactosidase [Pontiella agarivorans]MDZ8120506.1 beta-galactosidase [Pontiella agarivorans]
MKSSNQWTALLLSGMTLAAQAGLEEDARAKMAALSNLVVQAEGQGIHTLQERTMLRTADIFLFYADWDEANTSVNSNIFSKSGSFKDDPEYWAEYMPEFERQDVIHMLDKSTSNLTRLINGEISRKPAPEIDWAQVTHDGDQLTFNGRPAFVADYTWKPGDDWLTEYHGNQDGFYFDPNKISNASGDINQWTMNDLTNKSSGTLGFIFLGNKAAPNWAEAEYGPGFQMREDTYTGYDIDNPGAREMLSFLFDACVPFMSGKKFSELGYMLCNEPHFYTTKEKDSMEPDDWGWARGPVSEYTMDKFRVWLQDRHATVADLNALWGTSFADFDAVDLDVPIYEGLQGTPQWYDWVRFNQWRVTEWYTWVKSAIRANDAAAKVHLKVMPNLWSENDRGHGLDMEALTELSEIIGNDAGADHTNWWGKALWWQGTYAFDWREMCMSYDFFKSVSPEKITFNSEAHYLSTGGSRDLFLDPAYARATCWLAHLHGLTASQIWFWARQSDGSPRKGVNVGTGWWGSNNFQPQVVNEVAQTMLDLNTFSEEVMAMQRQRKPIRIFYSETSAINKPEYMDEIFELYEKLYFEGVPVGFVTENILTKQGHDLWDVVLVHETEFATTNQVAALQAYLDGGGSVVIDSDSLRKDEYGRGIGGLAPSAGTLISAVSLADMKEQALARVDLPPVEISETNGIGTEGCAWKCVTNEAGNAVVSIVNLGHSAASLSLVMRNGEGAVCTDMLTGEAHSSSFVLEPFEMRLLEVVSQDVVPQLSTIVQWGKPGGDDGIVTNTQNFNPYPAFTTYTYGNTASPLPGPDYYPDSRGRSPVFNHASKNAFNVKQITDGGTLGDYITTAKNDPDYAAMVVWENYLTNAYILKSLEIETRVNNSADTDSQFRWLVRKMDGQWYASDAVDTSDTFTLFAEEDPESLSWFDFTPHVGGVASVGGSASITLEDINAVGYLATFQQLSTNIKYRASETRYFKATAFTALPQNGWDNFVIAYGLSGDPNDDADANGVSDFVEYALGGNPTNSSDRGIAPDVEYQLDDSVHYYHVALTNPNSGVSYNVEWATNLVVGGWTNSFESITNRPSGYAGMDKLDYKLNGDAEKQLFFRLKVEAAL